MISGTQRATPARRLKAPTGQMVNPFATSSTFNFTEPAIVHLRNVDAFETKVRLDPSWRDDRQSSNRRMLGSYLPNAVVHLTDETRVGLGSLRNAKGTDWAPKIETIPARGRIYA